VIQGAPSDGQPGSLSAGAALRTTAVPCRTVASCRSTSRLCAFRSSPCCPPQRTWLRWRSNGTTSCRISTRIPQRAERIRPQPTGGDGSSQGRSTGIVAQADTTPGAPATVAKIWLQGLAAAVSQAAPHTSPTGDNVPRLPSFSGYSPASISRVLGCPQCPDKDGRPRSRLRRGLLCVALTSGNMLMGVLSGRVSGAAHPPGPRGNVGAGDAGERGAHGRFSGGGHCACCVSSATTPHITGS